MTCAGLHGGCRDVAILRVILHRCDQRLVPIDLGLREHLRHRRSEPDGLLVGERSGRDEVARRLVKNLR